MSEDDKELVFALRKCWQDHPELKQAADRIEAQAAEIEKLREALTEMFPLTDNRESYGEKYYRAIRIARAALGETK